MNEEAHKYAMKVQESIKWAIEDYKIDHPFSLEAHIYWKLKLDGWLNEPRRTLYDKLVRLDNNT